MIKRLVVLMLLATSAFGSDKATKGFTVTVTAAHTAQLNWTASVTQDVTGYKVYRGTAPGVEGATAINAALVTGTSYVDTGVVAGQQYFYRVTAVGSGGESVPSNEAAAAF